ncbi:hypothetical protein [Microbacterium sp. C7(2022)]|uniref:hypothetical protein n=1 Tax=Microbacterium sp. C7(2022) TaxID=2992759 RepID=UPI00237BC411|nr:hypothetical protein [Microbacterium sp. C7(2022)]MDE0546599.1 hypothetical protein [Microbacterium sp. C7(2022)]
MGYAERNTWAQLIASVLGTAVYLVIVVPQLFTTPVGEIAWQWPMVWTIGAAVAASIALSILWGIVAGMRDPDEEHRSDQRDREIEWFGDRVGQAFLVIGALAALIMAMLEVEWFWIGNTLFVGFFLSAGLGGLARLRAYHEGFQ